MRFGVCAGVESAEAVLAAGFDYVELPAAATLSTSEPTWSFERLSGLRIGAFNLFFPGGLSIYSDDWKTPGLRAVERASALGVPVCVLGSGGQRRAPEGMDVREAEARFVEIAAELDTMGQALGVRVAPESLNSAETNVGNDLASLARALAARGAPYTADSYHVLRENPDVEVDASGFLRAMPIRPVHVHVSGRDRRAPRAEDPEMQAFSEALRVLGYDGSISIEGAVSDLAQERRALDELFGG